MRALDLSRPPVPAPERVKRRYQLMLSRRDRWAKELERSTRLYAKAEREVRTYERARHGSPRLTV
jgi:hypothetical protein